MSKIFETPLWVFADMENRCFEIYDKNNDRVASDIEELEQAKVFAAAPDALDFVNFFLTVSGQALLRILPPEAGEQIYNEAKRIMEREVVK